MSSLVLAFQRLIRVVIKALAYISGCQVPEAGCFAQKMSKDDHFLPPKRSLQRWPRRANITKFFRRKKSGHSSVAWVHPCQALSGVNRGP